MFAEQTLLPKMDALPSIFVFCLLILRVASYNLEQRKPLTRTGATGKATGAYFGYSLSLVRNKNGDPRLFVGSPQEQSSSKAPGTQSSKSGGIYSCSLVNDVECSPSHPSNPQPGDRYGLATDVQPNGNFVACSPVRPQCGDLGYQPGACYKSNDEGKSWKEFDDSKNYKCPVTNVDVLFVLDGSDSVKGNFQEVKKWVKDVVKVLNINNGKVRVGVVQYSHYYENEPINKQTYIKTEIGIGQHSNPSKFNQAVDKIKLYGFTTYTGRTLEKVMFDFKSTKNFGKSTNKQVMILLTDGKANDGSRIPKAAERLRDIGVATFAVGVGDGTNDTEIKIIANGGNSNKRVMKVGKFKDLQKIVKNLETAILSFVLEGTHKDKIKFNMEVGEVGLAVTYSKPVPSRRNSPATPNGGLYLGAVGAYDWSGCVIKYDSVDDETADIPKYADVQGVLPNRTKESYMGYSVITGFFEGGSTEYVATGAPRYNLMGAVVVYRPVRASEKFYDSATLLGHRTKRQLGSYFGGSVLAVDVNNDGKDDLLVGAPLYVGDNHDEGRVFVYISRQSNTLDAWKSESYEPLELAGGRLMGGRFGTAMADAGDLNKDGYKDVIIGAPLVEGDRGAVFVYHGGPNGMDTAPKQKILASELTGVALKYFGQSLQGGVDLDGNQYPDIAVGAPKSDTVVIFRSRPVVSITATITYEKSGGVTDIDIFECIDKDYENCTAVTVCFTASGASIEQTIGLRYNLTLDADKSQADKRLEFRVPGSTTAAVTTLSKEVYIKRNVEKCFTENVHMKSTIGDYDSNVKTEVKYDLLSAHTAKPLSSVRDPEEASVQSATLDFAKKCGDDEECKYDLRLDASMILPPYEMMIDGVKTDLTKGGNRLVVDSSATAPLIVKVNLTNAGENAFDTKVDIVYSSQISFGTVSNRKSSTPTNSCIIADASVDLGDGLKKEVLRYNYRTNIMRPNAWCYFEFNLVTNKLRNSGSLTNFVVNLTASTSDSSSSSVEQNPADNSWGKNPEIIYRSDLTLTKKSVDIEIPFNETEGSENITSVMEIGGNTPSVAMDFEIKGDGHSNIPLSQVTLTWPSETASGDPLLYLYRVDCNPSSGNKNTKCSCDQSKINTYELTQEPPNANNTNGTSVPFVQSDVPIAINTSDCFDRKNASVKSKCGTIVCNITNLGASEKLEFSALFRLWTASILFNGSNIQQHEFRSRLEVDTTLSPLIINRDGHIPTVKREQIITRCKPYEAPIPVVTDNNIWIYILAAVGGLLLLIVIVIILWKVGFFKSKYADMKKDAEGDLADETDFQGNGNGSTADIMDE